MSGVYEWCLPRLRIRRICCYRGWGRVGAGRVGARGGGKVRLGVVFGEMWGIGYWGWGSGIEVLGRGYWDWYWDWYWG